VASLTGNLTLLLAILGTLMDNKTTFIDSEANEWFRRNRTGLENRSIDSTITMLCNWLEPFKSDITKIAEIGSGSGHRLEQLCKNLDAKGFGVDPSDEAIVYSNSQFPDTTSIVGTGDQLTLPTNSFDLVHLGFFLYLVDRSEYLKCIAEADRILKQGGFLSILDFDPLQPYSKKYSHFEGLKSYKLDNSRPFLSTGGYYLVNKFSLSHGGRYFTRDVDERVSLMLLYKEHSDDSYELHS